MTIVEARKKRVRRGQNVGQTWRIASNQFGYLMYAASVPQLPLSAEWSDNIGEAHLYDERDSRETKLKFWRAIASMHGLDPNCVQIVEA